MDFVTVHRDNLDQYSYNPFDENPHIPQTVDNHQGFSSLSHRVDQLINNLDHNNPTVEGSSWNPNSNNFLYPSFYDPFDPFQACFGKLNQEYLSAGCGTPLAQEYAAQNLHVQSRRFMDNIIINSDHSRTHFDQTMDHQYQMDEGFGYYEEKTMSLPNGTILDKGSSCFCLIVDEEDNRNQKTNGAAKQKAKRKRIVDNKSEIIKGQWTPEEDGLLVELVEKHGVRKWSSIAQMLPGRIGKQCRERWHNHLKPNIKKDRWSEEEDRILIEAHRQVGNRWAEIARNLPGRSENTIKNHWNATKRRQLSSRRTAPTNNNNKSKTSNNNTCTPLQNYIKSVISSNSDIDQYQKCGSGGGYLDNSSSGSTSSPPLMVVKNNNKQVLELNNINNNEVNDVDSSSIINHYNNNNNNNNGGGVLVADDDDDQIQDESLKMMMLPHCLMDSEMAHMHFDLQKEMDFMEMLSYGYI